MSTPQEVLVVVPSITRDKESLAALKGVVQYETRSLWLLLTAGSERKIVFVTSVPVPSQQIHQLLAFTDRRDEILANSVFLSARKAEPTIPLTDKVLASSGLLAAIGKHVVPGRTSLLPFMSTQREKGLADALDIPLAAADPSLAYWGGKSGSRRIFAEIGANHADGVNDISSLDDLVDACVRLWQDNPSSRRLMVKLDEGASGLGNATLDLPSERGADVRSSVLSAMSSLKPQNSMHTAESFLAELVRAGGLVEAFLEGEELSAPSGQGVIHADGTVEVLSTHEQVLGGPDGQMYKGASFPAKSSYRLAVQETTRGVGEALMRRGATGFYSVDFMVLGVGSDDLVAVEINFPRMNGTTHYLRTTQLLTGAKYDDEMGALRLPSGAPVYYVGTDNCEGPELARLSHDDLIEILEQNDLLFRPGTASGVIPHMTGMLKSHQKVGFTAVATSEAQAHRLHDLATQLLLQA